MSATRANTEHRRSAVGFHLEKTETNLEGDTSSGDQTISNPNFTGSYEPTREYERNY